MNSLPGREPLSTPYILISFAYCIVLSGVFYYLRSNSGRKPFGILTVNAVGCLALLAYFYAIGELYFSRSTLVFFWFVSSCLLAVKSVVLKALFDKLSVKITKDKHVLVVGEGEVEFDYLRATH